MGVSEREEVTVTIRSFTWAASNSLIHSGGGAGLGPVGVSWKYQGEPTGMYQV